MTQPLPPGSPYQQMATLLATQAGLAALAALATVPASVAPEVLAALVVRYAARSASLADLSLAAALTVARRRPVPALGLASQVDPARLREAFATVLADPSAPTPVDTLEPDVRPLYDQAAQVSTEQARTFLLDRARVRRIARAETFDAGQAAYGEAMRRRDVPGWRRRANPGACPGCRRFADLPGIVPVSVQMWRHDGCTCVQVPNLERTA